MPKITDPLPASLKNEHDRLCQALDSAVPVKRPGENLLVATWNICGFGGLTDKWRSQPGDSPSRDLFSLRCISEIVSRFDVVAVQEVKGNLRALRHMLKHLGSKGGDWSLLLTDITRGDPGHGERLAFIFDLEALKPSGLVCELVVPPDRPISEDAFGRQFARTPYAASFNASGRTFILVTAHILYTGGTKARARELAAIAEWLDWWAGYSNAFDHSLILLGDFNIDREDDECYQAFVSTGLHIPEELRGLPRTIFSVPGKPDTDKFYDQIAWFRYKNGKDKLSLKYRAGGRFDFRQLVMPDLTGTQLKFRMSDHFPLWVEFGL